MCLTSAAYTNQLRLEKEIRGRYFHVTLIECPFLANKISLVFPQKYDKIIFVLFIIMHKMQRSRFKLLLWWIVERPQFKPANLFSTSVS